MKLSTVYKLSLFLFGLILFTMACGGGGSTGPEEPRITEGPTLADVRFETAQINWETNVKTTSVVKYGTTSGLYDLEKVKDLKKTIHEVQLLNLSSNTNYFYVVESGNEQGLATSSEQQFTTLKALQDFIDEAWLDYDNGNFASAIPKFKQAIDLEPNGAGIHDAFNGLGWTYASNTIDSLDRAIENFDGALLRQPTFTESLAGRGFTYLALKKYNEAITDLESTLQRNANFEFSHNSEINANDVRLALAEGYFFRQELDKAQTEVNQLDPSNGLDAASSTTWVVDGVTYLTYAEALLAWIEKLKASV